MVKLQTYISTFISTPDIFFREHLLKKKSFSKRPGLICKKLVGNSRIQKEENECNEWLKSILSVRYPTNKEYIDKWRKIAINLIKGMPFPSKLDESWRLTSLDKVYNMRFSKNEEDEFFDLEDQLNGFRGPKIVFVNGIYSKKFSDLSSLDKNLILDELKNLPDKQAENVLEFLSKGESGINGGFFPTLNIACLSDIYVLSIPPQLQSEVPINIIYAGSSQSSAIAFNHRLVVVAGDSSRSKIIEHHITKNQPEYFDNTAVSILTKENSTLDFSLINESSDKSIFINSIHAEIKEFSCLNFSSISMGGLFSRINLGIDINGTNCKCNVKGISIANNNQTTDFHSRISHNLPNSQSSQLQKVLLTDSAHGVFAGKIQVQHGAGNTNSDQLCKTLLLSSNSRIDALPILEINNENVKCTHGSTVSDLDENQLFYLQSRGIPESEAKKLLTIGFVNEMINECGEEIKSRITRKIEFLM
jgi:Fe-S cluster assembly protein SufD